MLPGRLTRGDGDDPRWQAIIAVGAFVESDPEAVWSFVERWGRHRSRDLRAAVAICVVEDLLWVDFELFFPRVAALVRTDPRFAEAFSLTLYSGLAPSKVKRLERLQREAEVRVDGWRMLNRKPPRTVQEAIARAEDVLPGRTAPKDSADARWLAMFGIKRFLATDPEPIWEFMGRWGRHPSTDIRSAVGCVLLEHFLPVHFEAYFPRARDLARADARFEFTLGMCESSFCAPRDRRRLDRLMDELRPYRVATRRILARKSTEGGSRNR